MSFSTALNYTTGNWTVTSLTTDTVATAKTISIPDLSYSHDYAKTEDEPSEAKLANTTGTSLNVAERLRYARQDVKNVYASTDVGAANQMPVKTGVRTLAEANILVSATNAVSGAEYYVPLRAWVCVQVPTASFMKDDAVAYALGRALAANFDTGKTDESRQSEIIRGSLIPD